MSQLNLKQIVAELELGALTRKYMDEVRSMPQEEAYWLNLSLQLALSNPKLKDETRDILREMLEITYNNSRVYSMIQDVKRKLLIAKFTTDRIKCPLVYKR